MNNESDQDDEQNNDRRQSKSIINTSEFTFHNYNVYLDEDIGDPIIYRELINILFSADSDDIIVIYINSNGGHLGSAMSIIEGMKVTKAHVRVVVMGSCHSAASMISMYAHEITILDAAHSLIHTATFGSIGNTNNIKTSTDFTVKHIEKFLHATYDGFLTDTELDTVKSGVELWFDADELRKRMANRSKFLEKKTEKARKKVAKPK